MAVRKLLDSALTLAALELLPQAAFAQEEMARGAAPPDAAALIASALAAAPDAITAAATVTDLDGNVLREGTNGFTCMPDDPEIPGDAPICLDAGWQAFIKAWLAREEPPVPDKPAFIYALQGGGPPATSTRTRMGRQRTTTGSASRIRTSQCSSRTSRCSNA